ncbi:MarR family winged helix-turn-helix transcriptional regulator [Pseudonocardia endophytica]|uniref:MarR family transcriptional regulator n=1 Tax=Pseudonocardia endophytica TaxID=401976 RepID=A0A4R1HVS2_PSEEN|nr:MarR family winged helix-turn-helix transcriptional regulator [Pseudonocardia endophytica]TCK26837.1 MarR family transcriptional regulator [Pseudonocardia endophytica]
MQPEDDPPDDQLVDAVMTASRALLAVTARSLAAVDEEVTLPQYRALVVLAQRGPRRPADLAAALAVTPSTGTRMCDRLVAHGLVRRDRPDDDRRAVAVSLSEAGEALVRDVTRRRRSDLARLLEALPADRRRDVADALRAFSDAAGEVPETEWALAPVQL